MRPALLLSLVCLLVVAPLGAAETWKWRDASGRLQFSDRPPPQSVPDKDILQRPTGARRPRAPRLTDLDAPAPVPSPRAASEPALSEEERKANEASGRAARELEAKRKAQEAENQRIRVENCRRLTDYLRDLDAGLAIGRTNAQGEREVLDDQARAAEVARARREAANECKAAQAAPR